MTNFDSAVRRLVNAFSDDVMALVRQAADDAAREARRRQGAVSRGVSSRARKASSTRRGRRPSASTGTRAELEGRLFREIKRKGGRRIEELAVAMGEESKVLSPLAKRLLEAKMVSKKGQARATRYTAR